MNILNKSVLLSLTSLCAFSAGYSQETVEAEISSSTLLSECALERFSADITFGYESMYVFRGTVLAQSVIQPGVELGYDIGGGLGVYAGAWSSAALDAGYDFEVDLYGGFTYAIDALVLDLGYTYYMYPQYDAGSSGTNEIKFGATYDTSELLGGIDLAPSAYYYYDFDLEQHVLELAISYSMPICGLDYLSWDSSLFGGYAILEHDDYCYIGLGTGIGIAITENISISAGVRYSYGEGQIFEDASDSNVWFGTGIGFSF